MTRNALLGFFGHRRKPQDAPVSFLEAGERRKPVQDASLSAQQTGHALDESIDLRSEKMCNAEVAEACPSTLRSATYGFFRRKQMPLAGDRKGESKMQRKRDLIWKEEATREEVSWRKDYVKDAKEGARTWLEKDLEEETTALSQTMEEGEDATSSSQHTPEEIEDSGWHEKDQDSEHKEDGFWGENVTFWSQDSTWKGAATANSFAQSRKNRAKGTMATNGSMQRKENSAFHDPGYDRNAVKLRTPIEVTLKGAGTYAKGKGGIKSLWTPDEPTYKVQADPCDRGSGNRAESGGSLPSRPKSKWRPLASFKQGDMVQGRVTDFVEEGATIDFGCLVQGLLPKPQIDFPAFPGDLLVSLILERIEEDRVTLCLHDDNGWEAEYRKANSERSERSVSPKRGKTKRKKQSVRPDVSETQMADLPSEEQLPEEEAAETRDIFPKPDEVPRVTRSEMRGGPQAPRPSRFNRRQSDTDEVQSGGDQEEPINQDKIQDYFPDIPKAEQCGKMVLSHPRPMQACAAACSALKVLMRDTSTSLAALKGLMSLREEVGRAAEPLLVRTIPAILDLYGSRQRDIQDLAEEVAEILIARLNPYSVETILPLVLGALKQKEKTEIKVGALRLLALMRDEDTFKPLARQLDRIMPHIAEMLNDVKREVRETAADTAKALFECAQNKDLEPYLDSLIKAMMDQEVIPRVVNQLSEIVFVQSVETPALAVVMPLILRGLKDRDERTKRRALVIADNMCKLVPDITEIQPFLPTLIPLVQKSIQTISDPEVRSVATRCFSTLQAADKADRRKFISKASVIDLLQEKIPADKLALVSETVIDYVAALCASMSACRSFELAEWWQCVEPYISTLSTEECEDLVPDLLESCYDAAEGDDVEDLEEEGEDLCNCIFTLGYGALTLLNNTRLHLKRGRCYGLCGPNDCGKSTLLKAINNEQVEGFPPKSELVTAFVEHGVGETEPECEWTPLEYIFADETILAMGVTKKKVVAALRSVGFDDLKLKSEIGHLSGGWKMKLGLVRAMLMCADILLLDEPTGHLDVANVAWLGDYLLSLSKDAARPVTTIVVSHDTSFLDKVCSHVINVKQRKLKTYRGNITDFVRRCPEAKSYLSLTNDKQRFVLPEPGMLEGVKSKGKKLLKMQNVTYTYPGNDTPTLHNVSIEVSLLSRVAVIGPNGAGKSTMIKALVGELPVAGKSIVWKHPNVRISYVAQHAFHHVEQHLDKTPTQYLLWRFAGGEDCEALNHRAEEVNVEKRKYWLNEAGVLCKCTNEKEEARAVTAEQILGRKKSKSKANSGDEKYEYSVKWHNFSAESVQWVPREILVEMGHLRMVQREDEKQAAAHGLVARPLTQPQVEEHLAGFGLDSNLASHTRIGILSGGQKVKVVLGAAMWLSPHILILDEPTNYLDRDSLGALAAGLKEFGGGVIVISHNREFCHAVCDERWVMNAGRLSREGQVSKMDVALEGKAMVDEYTDEFGNVHKLKKKQPQTEKELKKMKRQKELARKRGDVFIEDEDEWWDKLQEEVAKPVLSEPATSS